MDKPKPPIPPKPAFAAGEVLVAARSAMGKANGVAYSAATPKPNPRKRRGDYGVLLGGRPRIIEDDLRTEDSGEFLDIDTAEFLDFSVQIVRHLPTYEPYKPQRETNGEDTQQNGDPPNEQPAQQDAPWENGHHDIMDGGFPERSASAERTAKPGDTRRDSDGHTPEIWVFTRSKPTPPRTELKSRSLDRNTCNFPMSGDRFLADESVAAALERAAGGDLKDEPLSYEPSLNGEEQERLLEEIRLAILRGERKADSLQRDEPYYKEPRSISEQKKENFPYEPLIQDPDKLRQEIAKLKNFKAPSPSPVQDPFTWKQSTLKNKFKDFGYPQEAHRVSTRDKIYGGQCALQAKLCQSAPGSMRRLPGKPPVPPRPHQLPAPPARGVAGSTHSVNVASLQRRLDKGSQTALQRVDRGSRGSSVVAGSLIIDVGHLEPFEIASDGSRVTRHTMTESAATLPPAPPMRRKRRFSSLETPRAGTAQVPKRSQSFHGADEVRRKIDQQAQQLLKSPRRGSKTRSLAGSQQSLTQAAVPTVSAKSTSASSIGTVIKAGAAAATPVYSQVRKVPSRPGLTESQPFMSELPLYDANANALPSRVQSLPTSPTKVTAPPSFVPLTNQPSPPPPPTPPKPVGGLSQLPLPPLPAGTTIGDLDVVFCGILPKGSSIEASHINVSELKVVKLNVHEIEASKIKAYEIEASKIYANEVEGRVGPGFPKSQPDPPPSKLPGKDQATSPIRVSPVLERKATPAKDAIAPPFSAPMLVLQHSQESAITSDSAVSPVSSPAILSTSEPPSLSASDVNGNRAIAEDTPPEREGPLCGLPVLSESADLLATYLRESQENRSSQGSLTTLKRFDPLEDLSRDARPLSGDEEPSVAGYSSPYGELYSGYVESRGLSDEERARRSLTPDRQLTSSSGTYETCADTLRESLASDDLCPTDVDIEGDFEYDYASISMDAALRSARDTTPSVGETKTHTLFYSESDKENSLQDAPPPLTHSLSLPVRLKDAKSPSPGFSEKSNSSDSGLNRPGAECRRKNSKSRSSWYDDEDFPGNVADNDDASETQSIKKIGPFIKSPRRSRTVNLTVGSASSESDLESTGSGGMKRKIASFFGSLGGSLKQERQRRHSQGSSDCSRRSSTGSGKHVKPQQSSSFYLTNDASGSQNNSGEAIQGIQHNTQICVSYENSENGLTSSCTAEDNERDSSLLTSMLASLDVRHLHPGDDASDAGSNEWRHSSSRSSDTDDDDDDSVASDDIVARLQSTSLSQESLPQPQPVTKERKAYLVARELMTSERVFVDVLKLLNEDFQCHIERANARSGQSVIPDEVFRQIVSSLPQLQRLNEDLLKDFISRIDNWDDSPCISDVIVKKGPFLKLYTFYIQNFQNVTAAYDEALKKYPAFVQAVKEFELSDRCKKLAVKHYMLKPVQRIPQYRLLLQDYLIQLTEQSLDYSDTVAALAIVSEVANHANETMRQGDNFAKLLQIQSKSIGELEVVAPGRIFVREGELQKLSRKVMQPRWFILFNDCLLHMTVTQQGMYRIHHELPLTGMKVRVPTHEEYKNEFSIISVTRSFTLSASSPEERDEWIKALNVAINSNMERRGTFVAAVLHDRCNNEGERGVLGDQAPVWIPDTRVTMCQLCASEFTMTFRRHHCRACGKVVCSLCSANRAPLHYLRYQTARVCDECFQVLHKEIESRDSVECDGHSDRESSPSVSSLKTQFKRFASVTQRKPKRRLPNVLKEVQANDEGSAISGYLQKRTKAKWKRLWFVIKNKVLYVYKASEDVAALESVPLLGFKLETFSQPFEGIHPQLLFKLHHPTSAFPDLVFYAESLSSAQRWIAAMGDATILD